MVSQASVYGFVKVACHIPNLNKEKKTRRHCFCRFFLSQTLWEDLNLANQELKTDKSLVLPPLVFPQIPGKPLAFLKFSGTLRSK